ncbi:MAG: hypothetical protein ABJE95_01595 [Byssovorax sp.]
MKQYYCGNPICKGSITSDSVDWPLRCEKCNQQCYPENRRPGGRSEDGSYTRTKDSAFALPTAILLAEGPDGGRVPFRDHPVSTPSSTRTAQRRPDTDARDLAASDREADLFEVQFHRKLASKLSMTGWCFMAGGAYFLWTNPRSPHDGLAPLFWPLILAGIGLTFHFKALGHRRKARKKRETIPAAERLDE